MQDVQAQGLLNAADEAVTVNCSGLAGVAIQLAGTFVGTVTFEGSVDGITFAAMLMAPIGDASTGATTATTAGIFVGSCAGLQNVRARMSAYTSGGPKTTVRAVASAPGLAFFA